MVASTSTSSANDGELRVWNCVTCRRRKVRCDRRDPCSNCTRAKIECHYPVTGRIPRRNRDSSSLKTPAQKQSELLSRLRRLEAVVTELSAQVEDSSTQRASLPSTSSDGGTASSGHGISIEQTLVNSVTNAMNIDVQDNGEFDEEFGSMVTENNGGLQIGKQFWSIFCSEIGHILQAVHDTSPPANISKESTDFMSTAPHDQTFAFGRVGSLGDLDSLNPLPDHFPALWYAFTERVHPFIQILDNSLIYSPIRELEGYFSTPGVANQALLFTISLAAMVSMNEADVMSAFGTEKVLLVAKYRLGTEQALGQANFLTSKDITTMQAFVIYLSILPYLGEIDLAWSLTGALLRLAESSGLTNEHTGLEGVDISPHDRLRWHIMFIDSRASSLQDHHSSPPEVQDNDFLIHRITSIISSINFEDLSDPHDIIYLLRRYMWAFARTFKKSGIQNVQYQIQKTRGAKADLRGLYDSLLKSKDDILNFARRMVDLFFANIELELHTRSRDPEHPTDGSYNLKHTDTLSLEASTAIIEAVYAMKTEPAWEKWQWQLEGRVPWLALYTLLLGARKSLKRENLMPRLLEARQILHSAPEISQKHHLWAPLLKLSDSLTRGMDSRNVHPPLSAPMSESNLSDALPPDENADFQLASSLVSEHWNWEGLSYTNGSFVTEMWNYPFGGLENWDQALSNPSQGFAA